ncbi:acyl-CoA dehydrogenase family protein [Methylomonas sp. SURF-2]|uniref:Acyl-CoA dehydrogenase family protein n=1 Tax=Methylomonas subterranea TaxID=2952225 RepID=A0ABT1TIU3_9GAMM|nr:acyl-CoA dehydrogenase family protein [Methylomonas sp. SURF-2]MCQ8105397.1 acyl-CoA dehydrogenase family protein [Methylomonas sp. SURF-2]
MDFSLSDEQKNLSDSIVKFAQQTLNTDVIARDRDHQFPRDCWQQCADMGIQGLPADEAYGGSNLDALSVAVALEALGYGCRDAGLVFSLSAHILACVVPLSEHGSDEQKQRYLPGLCDGSLIGMHAITEPGAGSDAFAMRTTAVADGDGWRLNGSKTFISNGPVGDVAIVFAMTNPQKGFHGGTTAFLLEKGMPGFSAPGTFEKLGLRTSPISELVFENVYLPASAVLGSVGGGASVFATAMDWERVLLVAGHVGAMQRLLETSIAYARKRSQSGQAIGKFQAISHKIADMKVNLEAARLLTYQAAWRLQQGKNVSMDAAITKLFVSESLVKTAMDSVQIHGGYGFMVDYEVERALRDAIGSTIYSGTSEIQRNIIARWLGL